MRCAVCWQKRGWFITVLLACRQQTFDWRKIMHFKGMEKIADLIVVNLLFILCALPAVTIGASATAMHYTLSRWQRNEGNLFKEFFHSFRLNFRQATILWIIFLVLTAVLILNFWLISSWTGPMYPIMAMMLIAFTAGLLAWGSVVFPLLAKFDNSTIQIAKNALLIALVSPVQSLGAMVLNVLPVVFAVFLPGLFLICSVMWLLLLCSASGLAVQFLFASVFDRIASK